jgi:peptide/nickel transport system substrate-binding protein
MRNFRLLTIALVLVLGLSATAFAYQEAPTLAAKVRSGELPPVEERLPKNPLVIEPIEEIGTYSSRVIRMAHRGPSDSTGYYRTVREPLINYNPSLTELQPNLAERWEVSEDGTTITYYLREGLKWSDGHPFTTEDVLFWWEVQNTPELVPTIPGAFVRDNVPCEVIALDELTVQFKFPVPAAAHINWIAAGGAETYLPKHYLSQFHKNYVDEETLTAMAKAEGLNTWYELLLEKGGEGTNWRAPGQPVMDAWIITTNFDDPILISERNPYYWKVDTEGNQLPYIDTLHRVLVDDIEVMKLQLINGQIDYITRHLWTTYGDLPMYMAYQQQGDYRIIRTNGGTPGSINIMPNVNYKADPVIAELINNLEFKKALSYAIDRQEINEVRFNGLGTLCHGHFHPQHPGYVEEVDKAYIEYNPALANQILDELGLTARDSEGYRLRPDGEKLTLIIDGSTHHLHHAAAGELITSYWKDIGIRLVLNVIDRGLWETRREGNEHMLTFADLADPLIPLEQGGHQITYVIAPLWQEWFQTNGAQGEEPSEDAKRIRDIYNTLAPATADDDVRAAYIREIAEIWGRNFWTIGTVGVPFNLSFAKNSLRNIPGDYEGAHSHPANPAIYQPYQWFWKE